MDAVANKVCALDSRGELRDYVDVDGILRSGRYRFVQLTELAHRFAAAMNSQLFVEVRDLRAF